MERRDDDDAIAEGLREHEDSEGLIRAQSEWRDVARIVAGAATVHEGERRLVAEMGFTDAQAAAILCMPVRYLARKYKAEFEADLLQLRRTLGSAEPS